MLTKLANKIKKNRIKDGEKNINGDRSIRSGTNSNINNNINGIKSNKIKNESSNKRKQRDSYNTQLSQQTIYDAYNQKHLKSKNEYYKQEQQLHYDKNEYLKQQLKALQHQQNNGYIISNIEDNDNKHRYNNYNKNILQRPTLETFKNLQKQQLKQDEIEEHVIHSGINNNSSSETFERIVNNKTSSKHNYVGNKNKIRIRDTNRDLREQEQIKNFQQRVKHFNALDSEEMYMVQQNFEEYRKNKLHNTKQNLLRKHKPKSENHLDSRHYSRREYNRPNDLTSSSSDEYKHNYISGNFNNKYLNQSQLVKHQSDTIIRQNHDNRDLRHSKSIVDVRYSHNRIVRELIKQKTQEQKEYKSNNTILQKANSSHSISGNRNRKSNIRFEKYVNDNAKEGKRRIIYRIKQEKFELWEYYKPIKVLGVGAYAIVIEAQDTRKEGVTVAIKKNRNVFAELCDAKRILREIKLLMHFNHDDIIRLKDVIPPRESQRDSFNDVYLVMQRMETTLKRVIESNQELTNDHYLFFIYQILRGLKYIHSAGVIHRDLKPENILVNGRNCNIKISDFGLARGVANDDELLTEYVITRWYRAPEVMVSARRYNEQVDMWSVGCMFAELLIKKPLFPGNNHFEQLSLIFRILGTPKPDDLDWIASKEAKEWVLNLERRKGCDLSKIFRNATKEALDLVSKMLIVNPHKRITVDSALKHPYFSKVHPDHEQTNKTCDKFYVPLPHNNEFAIRHLMYETLCSFTPTKKRRPRSKVPSSTRFHRNTKTDPEKRYRSRPESC